MKEIVSRFTMVNKGCVYVGMNGKDVCLYEDCFGDMWLAEFPFYPWNYRIEYYG